MNSYVITSKMYIPHTHNNVRMASKQPMGDSQSTLNTDFHQYTQFSLIEYLIVFFVDVICD